MKRKLPFLGIGGTLLMFFLIPLLLVIMFGGATSKAATGTIDTQGEQANMFDTYYREPIIQLQHEKGVLVPFSWLYGAMWYNDIDNTSSDKIQVLLEQAYTCGEDKCSLVSVDDYVANIQPLMSIKTTTQEELKNSIMLFTDIDIVFFGGVNSGGEDVQLSDLANINLSNPLGVGQYNITSRYGLYDPENDGVFEMHYGIDLAPLIPGQEGQAIYAMMDGTVVDRGYNDLAGNFIIIQSKENPSFKTRYLHMNSPSILTLGKDVKSGDVVGGIGDTGYSFGAHLHLEFHLNNEKINPELVYKFD